MEKFIEDGSIVLGGVMNRYQHDRAVRAYCAHYGLENPSISDDGGVFAFSPAIEEEIQIGWIK
jgi:hypothetical protein